MAGGELKPRAPAPDPSDDSASDAAERPGPRERLFEAGLRTAASVLQRLPAERALALGAGLGRTWARLHGPRVGDARVNLRIAFPEWSEEARVRTLERSLANLGRDLVEFAQLGRLTPEELAARVEIEGFDHLQRAIDATPSGGVIVMTAHFGSWELLASAMYARGLPVCVVHRVRDDPVLDRLAGELRSKAGTELLPRGSAARGALRALRDGKLLALTYDQNCRRDEGVFVPFFGRLACTRDGPPRVAMRTGAPVVPVFLHRQPDGMHHVARFRPALELEPEGDDKAAAIRENARRMAAAVEAAIRSDPDQWSWIHRRWRTQPKGEPNPYRLARRRL